MSTPFWTMTVVLGVRSAWSKRALALLESIDTVLGRVTLTVRVASALEAMVP